MYFVARSTRSILWPSRHGLSSSPLKAICRARCSFHRGRSKQQTPSVIVNTPAGNAVARQYNNGVVEFPRRAETTAKTSQCKANVKIYRFDELIKDLRDALDPWSGLTLNHVDFDHLTRVMKSYDAKEKGWEKYALANPSMGYTRNLVDVGNGKSNVLILVWTSGKGSPIHDHGNANCLMKILRGNLTETRYAFPEPCSEQAKKPMRIISETTRKEGEVAYMSDNLGVHRMSNRGSDFAVSLHLYTPPNVAIRGCNVFDVETSRKKHVPRCENYSEFGQRILRGYEQR